LPGQTFPIGRVFFVLIAHDASLFRRIPGAPSPPCPESKTLHKQAVFLILTREITTQERVTMKVGFGYDVHRLERGEALVLGGVAVPSELGLAGHSDADVLLHAVIDAMIGAATLGDIGTHFPPTDEAYRGISSITLLERTTALLTEHGYTVSNIDSTIVCQAPRLAPYIPEMAANIARAVGCAPDRVNVKAKTEEGLGFTGTSEGMKAYAVVMVLENPTE